MSTGVRDRRSGILLHPTSLEGPHGAGDLGEGAHRFAGWLAAGGQRVWQVLPLGPTGYGESPYQALSARAGNPALVSLERLRDEGWLADADLASPPAGVPGRADLAGVERWKRERLARAAERFRAGAPPAAASALAAFRSREAAWLEDWTLFRALKDAHAGAPWTRWPAALARRDDVSLRDARGDLDREVYAEAFVQWTFERQWSALRQRCAALGVKLLGDLPIYPAHDSVEVWAHAHLFRLDGGGEPVAVAGVPPDYFSATGQRWGNPLHDWEASAAEGHRTWVARVRGVLARVDRIRLDHFRGFEAFWEVPAAAPDASSGRWVPGPGPPFFEALQAALGPLPFVAENLGVVTPEVEALRRRFGLPGMAILQFAFGNDPQAPTFRPHAYTPDTAAYTGTHDNDTVVGWWTGGAGASVRSDDDVAREKAFATAYLASDGREIHWDMIRALAASVADDAIFPMQDVLGLGSAGRMNTPATLGGNWSWRLRPGELRTEDAARLARLVELYGRHG